MNTSITEKPDQDFYNGFGKKKKKNLDICDKNKN